MDPDEFAASNFAQVLFRLYHVARGNRDSADVLASSRIRTMQGGFLFQSGGVLTDANSRTSNIVAVDIKASNGVIHVIDRVVLP